MRIRMKPEDANKLASEAISAVWEADKALHRIRSSRKQKETKTWAESLLDTRLGSLLKTVSSFIIEEPPPLPCIGDFTISDNRRAVRFALELQEAVSLADGSVDLEWEEAHMLLSAKRRCEMICAQKELC